VFCTFSYVLEGEQEKEEFNKALRFVALCCSLCLCVCCSVLRCVVVFCGVLQCSVI